jgi:hypothetical protein
VVFAQCRPLSARPARRDPRHKLGRGNPHPRIEHRRARPSYQEPRCRRREDDRGADRTGAEARGRVETESKVASGPMWITLRE